MTVEKELSDLKLKDGETRLVAEDVVAAEAVGADEEGNEAIEYPDLGERYEVLELIGQGGMGKVYKVRDKELDQILAIKVLRKELSIDKGAVKRFEQEVKSASELTHPNLAAVYGHGTASDGTPFMVMEYLGENNLARVLKDIQGESRSETPPRGMDADRSMNIFAQVGQALIHAHANGIVHRDLKPSNIILTAGDTEREVARVVDFGIAKIINSPGETMTGLTQTGDIFGSPLYMSPEQCDGEALDARSDIYSFGCVMFEVLCGVPPFSGGNPFRIMMKHVNEPVPQVKRIDVPSQLKQIVATCMSKAPKDRYQSVEELMEDLERAQKRESLKHGNKKKPALSKETIITLELSALALVFILVVFVQTAVKVTQDDVNLNSLNPLSNSEVIPNPVSQEVSRSMVMFKPLLQKPTLKAMTYLKPANYGLPPEYDPLSEADKTRLAEYLHGDTRAGAKNTDSIVAMGTNVIPTLLSELDNIDDNVAKNSAKALSRFGNPALRELADKFKTSSNVYVSQALQLTNDEGIKAVSPYLQEPDPKLRGRATALIKSTVSSWNTYELQYNRELPDDISEVLLWSMRNDPLVSIRADSAFALCCAPTQGPLRSALAYQALNDNAPAVRAQAAASFIKVAERTGDRSQQTLDIIGYLMQNDPSDEVKTSIIDTCRFPNDLTKKLMPYLRGAWAKASFNVKSRLLSTFMSLGQSAEGATPDMIEALRDDKLREMAVNALARIGPRGKEALPVLHEMIRQQISTDAPDARTQLDRKMRIQEGVKKIMQQDPNAH